MINIFYKVLLGGMLVCYLSKVRYAMKKYNIIFSFSFLLISALMAVEVDNENVNENEKFKFIEDIYSESWALIIGINSYQHVDPLSFAVDDALAINKILSEKYGFKKEHIKLITDDEATKDNIMNGFQEILLSAGENDRIVVFYAGHGDTYPLPNGGDMGYLIPVDGEATKDRIFLTSISMSRLEELATMSAAKHILYLVDACYGGLTLATRGLGKEQTPEYLRKMTKEKGRQVITAGGKDEKVMEKPEWGHSAFTKNLISGLENELADANNDGIISGEELGGFIRSGVAIDTDGQHTPQKGRIGSDVGEFVFISQTLADDVAMVGTGDEDIDEIKEQMAAQQEQMAQLTELLLAQAQGGANIQEVSPVDNYPDPVKKSKKSKRPKQPVNMKTASTLSWVFPGMGHYYSGKVGKGLMFTGLELISVVGIIGASAEYSTVDQHYQDAMSNMAGPNGLPMNCEGMELPNCYSYWKSEASKWNDSRNEAQVIKIVSGSIAGVIWMWNILDVKKNKSSDYSKSTNFSVGVDRYGQVEARINF